MLNARDTIANSISNTLWIIHMTGHKGVVALSDPDDSTDFFGIKWHTLDRVRCDC